MRKKKLPSMALVVALSAGVAGCDTDPGADVVQRDVYSGPHALENCIADWGNAELCKQQLDDAAKKKVAQGSPGSGASSIFIWGPGYYGSDRSVTHQGVTYTPSATKATHTAQFDRGSFKPTSFSAPRPSGVSARGGFGTTGRGLSSSGG